MRVATCLYLPMLLSLPLSPCQAGEIEISESARVEISKSLKEARMVFRLDRRARDFNRRLFRVWVSGSMELSEAQRRQSRRFERITFSQDLVSLPIRRPTERLELRPAGRSRKRNGMLVPRLGPQPLAVRQSGSPTRHLYREGSSYHQFLRMEESKVESALEKSAAIDLARAFLEENHFLNVTPKDGIGYAYVTEARINEDPGEYGEEKDFLVRQDVLFQRRFQGRPVVNSKITVGLHPDEQEIVIFKHVQWTPTRKKARRVRASKLRKLGLATETAFTQRLKQKIRTTSGSFTSARVETVIPAWFQAEDRLIPVLAFDIAVEFAEEDPVGSRRYIEILNLVGGDDAFLPSRRPVQSPVSGDRVQ